MKLEIFRQMTYISPSSFKSWENCQYKTYLTRLAGHPFMKSPAGPPAKIGTAFDAYIKDYIAKKKNIKSPVLSLHNMLADVEDEFKAIGSRLAKAYISNPLIGMFLDTLDLKLEQEMYTNVSGVPLLGRIDAIIESNPFDWKVRGFGKSKVYPTKGYNRKFIYNGEKWYEMPVPLNNTILEESQPDWAVQKLFYCWILGRSTRPYHVHELINRGDELELYVHQGNISREFAANIMVRVKRMWENITDQFYYAEIDKPFPVTQRCERYGVLCEAAHLCKFYKETLGDAERRATYL